MICLSQMTDSFVKGFKQKPREIKNKIRVYNKSNYEWMWIPIKIRNRSYWKIKSYFHWNEGKITDNIITNWLTFHQVTSLILPTSIEGWTWTKKKCFNWCSHWKIISGEDVKLMDHLQTPTCVFIPRISTTFVCYVQDSICHL